MDKVYEISMLLDFYGQLLTPRQYEILDLHYNNDYSFGEIGEQLDISRQGVYDNIKRSKAALYKLEDRLGLVKRFLEQREKAAGILQQLDRIEGKKLDKYDKEILEKVRAGIVDMINGI